MKHRTFARRASAIGATIAASFLLAGCFDIDFDVSLKNDGSGTIVAKSVFGKQLTQMAKGEKQKREESILAKNNKKATVSTNDAGGRRTTAETLNFAKLSEVKLDGSSLEVIDLGRTFYGVDRSRIRWTSDTKVPGGKRAGHDKRAEAFTDLFKGYFYTMTMHVPCNVTKTTPGSLGGKKLDVKVETSMMTGSTVQWKLPLELLIASDGPPPNFEVECWSWYGIPASKTK